MGLFGFGSKKAKAPEIPDYAKDKPELWARAVELAQLTHHPEWAENYYRDIQPEQLDALESNGIVYYSLGWYSKAEKVLLPACQFGSQKARFLLGMMYAEGIGIPRDAHTADILFQWMQPAVIGEKRRVIGEPFYVVPFGSYPSNANGDKIAQMWIVLDRRDDKLLLLSREVIDAQPYHASYRPVTWKDCDLRRWLNKEFLELAFTPYERKRIVDSMLDNPDNPVYGTEGGSSTVDKVFLLSLQEAQRYFIGPNPKKIDLADITHDPDAKGLYFYPTNTAAILNSIPPAAVAKMGTPNIVSAVPTRYARMQGVEVVADRAYWWLRSPGMYDTVATTAQSGDVLNAFGHNIDKAGIGVRPAIWVSLKV